MKTVSILRFLVPAVVLVGVGAAPAAAADVDHAISLSYSAGANDVFDFFDDLPGTDVTAIPVGLSYRPIINFDNGLRVDIGVGPMVLVLVETLGGDTELEYFDLGLSGTAGWNFTEDSNTNFYLRGGVAAHLIDSDFSNDSSAFGLVGAAGVEFAKQKSVNGFIEAVYDTSEIEMFDFSVGPREVNPHGFMISGGVILSF